VNGIAAQIEALSAGLEAQRTSLAGLTETVRGLCDAQQQWKNVLGQLSQALGKVSL
jgi:hypothetical protein